MAGFREIPAVSREEAEKIIAKAEAAGVGSAFLVGKPNQPLLGVPVGMERVGLVVPGGLNPVAALEEAGIETESKAWKALVDFDELQNFGEI